jgi:cell division protein ZapA
MPQVAVTINGRKYAVACDEGQEERTRDLARYVEGKVAEFAKTLDKAVDSQLLLLASLVIADELAEATETVRRLRRGQVPATNGRDAAAETVLANGIDNLAQRIEAIAVRLEKSQL